MNANENILSVDTDLVILDILYDKPELSSRIKASMIDLALVSLLMIILNVILSALNLDNYLVHILGYGSILLYEPIMTSTQQTLGQKIMNIKVIHYPTLKNTNKKQSIVFFASILRYITKIALGWISLLTIHPNSYGRALHDISSQSVIIKLD
jgi:uncharacterized RDD family membrane protein YckC